MKKVISLALLSATTSLMAMYAEHAYLYKDPRVMGMGGANVAVGSYSSSVFSNPAGLTNIKKQHGLVVDILNLSIAGSNEFQDIAQDISDANDADDSESEMAQVLSKYSGRNFHLGVDNYMSVSKNSDAFAWTLGILAAADVNLMPHGSGTSSGGVLETSSRVYGGIVLGAAKSFQTKMGTVDLGMSIKYISQMSYEGVLGINELVEENGEDIATEIQNKYEKEASGFGVDLGLIYKPWKNNSWNPAFGLSVLNIGSMDMDSNYGKQPMTVNIGASLTPDVSFMNKLVLAVDYVDLLNANETRVYQFSSNNTVKYKDYEESDPLKRVRIGAMLGLYDTSYSSMTLNVGMYQGAYTAGLDLALTVLKINLATYEEQIGTGSVDIADRRYIAQISLGW